MTLIELLIAIAITAGALATVTFFAVDLSNFGINLGDRLENERELELTLRTMMSEIRSMGPGGNGSYPIAQASSSSFTFFSDIDADGAFEQVRYFTNGTTLQKGVTEPADTNPVTYPPANEVVRDVVHNLTNASNVFTYYPEGYAPETGSLPIPINVSFIRMLKVTGTTDRDQTRPPAASTLSIMVTIRNIRGEI
jgi:type II secretory pathway pseudopilin PulG